MFKKKCPRCNRKIDRDFDFCPYCGNNLGRERDEKDFGFLGKDDFIGTNLNFNDAGFNLPLGFDKIISGLMNQIDGQMGQLDKEIGKNPVKKTPEIKSNAISISISTGTGKQPEIKISGFGPEFEQIKQEIEPEIKVRNSLSDDKAKEIAKLPREEAVTNVRRLSSKIIYEIELPGVSSLKDVLINKLENSTEIKAFSKNKVYVKLIPLTQLLNYKLNQGKLILEFKTK